jgi:outer membrane protein assembly factor BamB
MSATSPGPDPAALPAAPPAPSPGPAAATAEAKPAAPAAPDAEAKAALIAKAKAAAAAKAAAPPPAPPAPVPAAPAPAAPAAVAATSSKITLEISAKTIGLVFTVLVLLVVLFGGLNLYLLIRLGKEDPVKRVVHQPPGLDGNLEQIEKPLPPKGTAATAKVAPKEGEGEDPAGKEKEGDAPVIDANEVIKIGETFKAFDGTPADIPGSWPTFRGPAYDNISREPVKLLDRWPSGGPKVLWSHELGEGYAGAAIHKGRVYVLDYDETTREDALRCFSLEDGKEIWRRSYKVMVRRHHGISRTVPAVTDKHVVTIGPRCHVMCVDAASGDLKWGLDLVKEYGTKVPNWWSAQNPLIDGTTAVIAPAGPEGLMIGVDCETGKVLWKTPNPKNWKLSHSSILPMTFGGRRMYLYMAIGGIVAVAGDGPAPGAVLWESTEWFSIQTISSSPLVLEDGYVFFTTGYKAGSFLLRVTEQGGTFQAATVWKLDVKDGLACEQQTPVYYNKLIYSVNPLDSGVRRDQLVCMDPYNGGKVLWASEKQKRYGHYEPFMIADGKLFVMSEHGELSIVKPSRDKFEPVSEVKLLQGKDPWAPIAIAGGRMILRDDRKMLCLDVRAGSP